MMASRGMGVINPSKMPKKKVIERTDDPNKVDLYANGGKTKKFSGDDGESLVEMSKRGLSERAYSEPRLTDEELLTKQPKMRAMNLQHIKDDLRAMPSYVALEKGYKGAGARVMGTKKLDKDSMLQAYIDAQMGKAQGDGLRGSIPGFGVSYTRQFAKGGKTKSKVNEAGNYTKPGLRKALFESIKAQAVQGTAAGEWSARKAQLLAKQYKAKGGGYKG